MNQNTNNNTDAFVWTDELVAEYSLATQPLTIWEFKRSKQAPIEVERVKVNIYPIEQCRMTDGYYRHSIHTSIYLDQEKYESIKLCIERELNNDYFDNRRIQNRINQLKEMEEAFNDARLTHPMVGFKYDTFNDWCIKRHNENFPNSIPEKDCIAPTLERQYYKPYDTRQTVDNTEISDKAKQLANEIFLKVLNELDKSK